MVVTGFSKGGSGAGAFGSAAQKGTSAAGTASPAGGAFSGFVSRYKPNSVVRDAVVNGGTRMGAGGSVGFVGRVFGGMAVRGGAALTAESVASVANRPGNVSGSIGGDVADRSLANFMPHLAGGGTASHEPNRRIPNPEKPQTPPVTPIPEGPSISTPCQPGGPTPQAPGAPGPRQSSENAPPQGPNFTGPIPSGTVGAPDKTKAFQRAHGLPTALPIKRHPNPILRPTLI